MRLLALFPASIRPPIHSQERPVHSEAIQNCSSGGCIKYFVPLGRDEISCHDGGFRFSPFCNDLEDGIGLIL